MSSNERTDEEKALALKAKGISLFRSKDYEGAVRTWTRAIDRYGKSITPDTLRALKSNRSVGYFEGRKWCQAMEEARNVIKEFPHAPKNDDIALKSYLRIGRSLVFLSQDKSALIALKLHKALAQRRYEEDIKAQQTPPQVENKEASESLSPPVNRHFTKKDQARIDQLDEVAQRRKDHERANPPSKSQKTIKYEVLVCNGQTGEDWNEVDGIADDIRFVFFHSVPAILCTKADTPRSQAETTRLLKTLVVRHTPKIRATLNELQLSTASSSDPFKWTCVGCDKPATSVRHNPISYLEVDEFDKREDEPGPWILDTSFSVCEANGTCDLEVERENRIFFSEELGIPEGNVSTGNPA